MSHIDFYICESGLTKEVLACRLIEKAYQQQSRVYVYTDSKESAEAFDEKLWAFEDNSFIPHNTLDEKILPAPPVRIGYGELLELCRDGILINLSNDFIANHTRFSRVIEFVEETNKTLKREQFKQYRDQHNDLHTYKV